ncbi:hypothetical protein FHX42_002473 [Saccharopolyspora lacisalsi]|uniref:Uncharacterized protein n=1 Tax=Halosaccharopolyspora lacisalsi TaxID=1000566 RepID=A0A839DT19_9PSEU|nr:hypothetical protein [Halosaccharopolyspora lacisalsi]MBA8825122.1 hypothetical protein [Halosaccharopolyspora lacisalsi]
MTVSQPLGKSLAARTSWCRTGEPIVWTFPQTSLRYDVEGLDLSGKPLPGWGKRAGKNVKRAASAVGGTALDVGLTAVFGGGGEPGRNVGGNPKSDLPDVVVFGGHPNSKAARLLSLGEAARLLGSTEVTLDHIRSDWILTSHRLSLVVSDEAQEEEAADAQQASGSPFKLLKQARSFTEKHPEKFGPNPPGTPLRSDGLRSFFDIDRNEIKAFDTPQRELSQDFRGGICFRVVLDDDSGFDFCEKYGEPLRMMEMTMGRA